MFCSRTEVCEQEVVENHTQGSPGKSRSSFAYRMPTDSSKYNTVLDGLCFTMEAFLFVVSCALVVHSTYCLDEHLDEIQREEDRLPYYLKDDGIRRVAKLNKDHFDKTLRASRMLVVLFYFSSSDNNEAEYSWKADEKMLEVSYICKQMETPSGRITSIEVSKRPDRRPWIAGDPVYLSHETNALRSRLVALNLIHLSLVCVCEKG